MRKLIAAALVALTVLPLAARADEATPITSLQGEIAAPTRFTDGTSGWPGLVRRTWLAAAGTNGTIGYVIKIDRDTWGGRFVIDQVDDLTGAADLDVYFYSDFGDVAGDAAPESPENSEFVARTAGGEEGIVPEFSTRAIVFTANGVMSTFRYQAFAPAP